MENHEHNHSSCCKHEHIRYCSKCMVTYCQDCGREWFDKCTLNHYPQWTYTTTSTPQIYYGTTCQTSTYKTDVPTTLTNCQHN
jgi:hypothetical protein